MKVTDEQWEQRRYEIAKEVLPVLRSMDLFWPDKDCAEAALSIADALIAQLRDKGERP